MTKDELFAVARRHAEYADEPDISEQKRKDHLIAASVLLDVHVMIAAEDDRISITGTAPRQ